MLVRPTLIVVFDAVKDALTVVTPVRPEKGVDAKTALNRAIERLSGVVDALDRPLDKSLAEYDEGPLDVPPKSNTTPAEYKAMVLKAKDYIAAGDAFQIVLAQRFEAPFTLPPFSLYRALRRTNPSPYLYFLDFGDFAVAGSSPEILVKVSGDVVTIRPIAGTRPRGASPHEDKALEEELLADPKERAEHLMLLDLGRNDVGRVAKIGTVKVTDQFFVERYSHVMHIVSNVEGKLDDKHDALDALAAGFPAGTVSGAPKVRAMQIIDELEKEKRGLYAGAVGYFSAAGEMDTCIVLRTALVKNGTMYVQAGAGIVSDCDPDLRAAGMHQQGEGLVPRRRRSAPVCQRRQTRAIIERGDADRGRAGGNMGWLNRLDRLIAGVIAAAQWLALPLIVLLFLQWPLRDIVRCCSRQANDLGQIVFALLVAVSVTAATRAGTHLAADTLAQRYSPRTRHRLRKICAIVGLLPWALFILYASKNFVLQSLFELEAFADTDNPGYFIIKLALWLMALLVIAQALVDIFRPLPADDA